VDTSYNSVTITLPDSPGDFEYIYILPKKKTFKNKPCILRSTYNIEGSDDDYFLDVNWMGVKVMFLDNEWRIV
jgi:hypothetical protein